MPRRPTAPSGTVGWCYTAASPNAHTLPPWWNEHAPEPGSVLVVLGEPGVGKSALLRDLTSPRPGR